MPADDRGHGGHSSFRRRWLRRAGSSGKRLADAIDEVAQGTRCRTIVGAQAFGADAGKGIATSSRTIAVAQALHAASGLELARPAGARSAVLVLEALYAAQSHLVAAKPRRALFLTVSARRDARTSGRIARGRRGTVETALAGHATMEDWITMRRSGAALRVLVALHARAGRLVAMKGSQPAVGLGLALPRAKHTAPVDGAVGRGVDRRLVETKLAVAPRCRGKHAHERSDQQDTSSEHVCRPASSRELPGSHAHDLPFTAKRRGSRRGLWRSHWGTARGSRAPRPSHGVIPAWQAVSGAR